MGLWISYSALAGRRMEARACMSHCLGTLVWQECALNSLVKWSHHLCSAYGERLGLCSLTKCYCKHTVGLAMYLLTHSKFPGWTAFRLHSAISGGYELVWEAALKLVKHFFALTQANLCPKFSDQTGPLAFYANSQLFLHFFWLDGHWATQFPSVLSNPSGQMGLEATVSGIMSQLSCLGRNGRGHSR